MPGAGCAMPQFMLFLLLVVLCSIALCCVVSCGCRWVVVSRVVCRCWVTPVFVECCLVVRYRVLPWYCVARHSVLRCAGSCRGVGIWLCPVVVGGGVDVVCSSVRLWCVVARRVLCWFQGGSPCCAHLCVAPLRRVSLRVSIGLCVSWCPFSRVALGLFWCWVSSCCVMCLGMRCVLMCCVVALCFGALGWTLVCGVRYCCSMLCVVVCRLVALYNTLCCAPSFCRWLWCYVPCCRVCCRVLCLGIAWCCGFVLLVALRSSIVVPCSSAG